MLIEVSTEKLTNFIKEVCLEFSELLFFTVKSVNEIRELDLVKNALNERYKIYYNTSIQLEKEIQQLRKLSNANFADFSVLNKEKLDLKKQLDHNKSIINSLNETVQVNSLILH